MTHLKDLVIFVEGPFDETFFKRVVLPELKNEYKCDIQKYQNLGKPEVNKTVQGYLNLDYDCMFVCDFDKARSISDKIKEICDRYSSMKPCKVVVVKKVIEGWYLAVLSDNGCNDLKKRCGQDGFCKDKTDDLTKNDFKRLGKRCGFAKAKTFGLHILNYHSIKKGVQRNASFNDFCACYSLLE